MIEPSNRFRGCLLGLAAGDAVGTSVEFMPRGSFKPLSDMVGGGPFHLKAGNGPMTLHGSLPGYQPG